jgi:hypothetical protein
MTRKDWDSLSRLSVWWGVFILLLSRWVNFREGPLCFYTGIFFVALGMLNLPKRPQTKEQLFDPDF